MMDIDRETQAYNPGHQIEGLDRCHTLLLMLDSLLVGHPAVVRAGGDPLIEQAHAALFALYHRIGTLDDSPEE